MAQSIGRPDLIDDPRFKDNTGRVDNRAELNAIIQEWIGARPLDEAEQSMRESGAVVGPVFDTAMMMEDPHYAAREDIISVPDPDLGQLKMSAPIPKFSKTPGEVRHTGPKLGEHNESVYGEWLGYNGEKLGALKEEGII